MTPELEALARRAVACPRWRWMPGMRTLAGSRVTVVEDEGAYILVLPTGWGQQILPDDPGLPDLTDPATLGCILALVRKAHGPATVVRLVGVNGRGVQEWAISGRGPAVDGWHLAAPALGYWESEAEALVAALENGGGGA